MSDQDSRSNGPIVVRRIRRDRVDNAVGDFVLAIAIGCVVMAIVVTVARDSPGWLLALVGLLIAVAAGVVLRRALRSEVRLAGENLVIKRTLPTKIIAVGSVRSVWETTRFRRVSTTTLHLVGVRRFRTKAATKKQIQSLLDASSSSPGDSISAETNNA